MTCNDENFTSILCYVEKLCLRQEACLASFGFAFFTSRRVPSQSKSKTIVRDVRTVRKWNCQCFHCPTRRRHRHSRWIFHGIKMMPGATQARHFSKRRRKPSWTIEERVVLHNIVVAEARKREIEIKKDSMDTVPGVNKIDRETKKSILNLRKQYGDWDVDSSGDRLELAWWCRRMTASFIIKDGCQFESYPLESPFLSNWVVDGVLSSSIPWHIRKMARRRSLGFCGL